MNHRRKNTITAGLMSSIFATLKTNILHFIKITPLKYCRKRKAKVGEERLEQI